MAIATTADIPPKLRGDTWVIQFEVTNAATGLAQPLDAAGSDVWFTLKSDLVLQADAAALYQGRLGEKTETGTAQAGAAATITLTAGANSIEDDFYKGLPITITGGTGSGQSKRITAYTAATRVATVDSAWSTPPNTTSTYKVVFGTITVLAAPDNNVAEVVIEPGVTKRFVLGLYDADIQVKLPGTVRTFTPHVGRLEVRGDVTREAP